MNTLAISLIGCLWLYLLVLIIKFINKVWWNPIRIQSLMRSQGIQGPSYKFLHGNTKEITDMRKATATNAMEVSSHELLRTIQPHVYSWTKIYGMNFLNWYGPKPQLVVTEPELVREILNNKDGAYPKAIIQDFAHKLFGNGLNVARGEAWSKKRKLADYAFHGESLKNMIPAMIASADAMLERWKENKVKNIEVSEEFTVLTSEIISRTAFGSSYVEGKNTFEMLRKMALIISRNNYKIRVPGIRRFWKSRDDIESDTLAQGIRNSIIKMIDKREEEVMMGQQDSYGNDYLGILLKAHHGIDETTKISLDDVIDECKTIYIAGQETIVSSLTWMVFLLAIHTDWQDRARQEVLDLFGREKPSPDSIGRLKIMSMIVHESLRLYAPVFNITREVQREVRLQHLILPEKMALSLSVLALHHNPQIWGDDVHLFKPERFANGMNKSFKDRATAFLPFGLGPRTCVGMNFAMAEIKTAVSMILQHYRFYLSPTYVHSPIHILSIRPQFGLQIILEAL